MPYQKKERWTEADIDALPVGEHDYFERKSGIAVRNRNAFIETLAKAGSAFLNSGGGSLILGVSDAGHPDGLPEMLDSTRTRTRDWVEQKIPEILDYPANDFRVHQVERHPSSSRIPDGMVVLVVDFGDSSTAPHQRKSDKVYFYRAAGRSVPAPHFYLELLRQRLTEVKLKLVLASAEIVQVYLYEKVGQNRLFYVLALKFQIENVGRVAAYKWALKITRLTGAEGVVDASGDRKDFPQAISSSTGVRLDDTILPGISLEEERFLGFGVPVARDVLPLLIGFDGIGIEASIATETSAGVTETFQTFEHLGKEAFLLPARPLLP